MKANCWRRVSKWDKQIGYYSYSCIQHNTPPCTAPLSTPLLSSPRIFIQYVWVLQMFIYCYTGTAALLDTFIQWLDCVLSFWMTAKVENCESVSWSVSVSNRACDETLLYILTGHGKKSERERRLGRGREHNLRKSKRNEYICLIYQTHPVTSRI